MRDPKAKAFDVGYGVGSREMWVMYLLVVLGIILHWIWELAVAAIGTGSWDFGTIGIVVARLVVAFIAGLVSFAGVWKQLEQVDPKIRAFVAITQGFAIDALAGPLADAAQAG